MNSVWVPPLPRIWAYSQLFLKKSTCLLFGEQHEAPQREGLDYGIWQKILYFWSKDPTPIPSTNIYLGSAKNAADFSGLLRNDVSLVVNVTRDVPNFFDYEDGIEYIQISLLDTEGASLLEKKEEINATLDRVLNHKGNVLAHCMMGASRSVSFVCLYLMKRDNIGADEAYKKVSGYREAACINSTFLKEMQNWTFGREV